MKLRRRIRKIVSTMLIGAMIFFAPSMMPTRALAACGTVHPSWLATDTAFAQEISPTPCPVGHSHVPAWPWVVIGCAGSIVLSALVADFRDHRELTTPEAWTCGLLYWIAPPQQAKSAVRAKG